MAEFVYTLCAATSILCAWLLFRGYRRHRTRLLFWSALCFSGLALNNALLLFDLGRCQSEPVMQAMSKRHEAHQKRQCHDVDRYRSREGAAPEDDFSARR